MKAFHVHFMALVLATCSLLVFHTRADAEPEKPPPRHYNIVLIGATGDLAAKYLWRGLFDLFQKNYKKGEVEFAIYGGARTEAESGRKKMGDILLHTIKCGGGDCRQIKTKFIEAIQYHQLKTEKHYEDLGKKIAENTQGYYALYDTARTYEEGRMVYLSVPPTSYGKISKWVHQHLRPQLGHPWMRIILEKPFGQDWKSAEKLAKSLSKFLKEQETYRIDHYLGKTVVQQVLPFRVKNQAAYSELWSRKHIERVDIVMKEKLDVKGRTSFYDQVGLIRDVKQNHLMELMALVGMELPKNSGNITEIVQRKVQFLQQVKPIALHGTLIGQYDSYQAECQAESNSTTPHVTNTPTFAATALFVDNPRWEGVPFLLTAGKKLGSKASYIRVLFKKDQFCLTADDMSCSGDQEQVLFYIGGGDVNAMITTTQGLPTPKDMAGWRSVETNKDLVSFGVRGGYTRHYVPEVEEDAYASLINAVFTGQKHLFVDTASLLESWRVWTPVLDRLSHQQPKIYQPGESGLDTLRFKITGNNLEFLSKKHSGIADSMDEQKAEQVPSDFCGNKLVCTTATDLINKLALDITSVAETAVVERGEFHLALSGGESPVRLLQTLVDQSTSFPWYHTHVWLVDERCVPLDSPHSNFNLLRHHLLPWARIPYLNIHPMPVDIAGTVCGDIVPGDTLYEASINKLIPNQAFDYILLGVGTDGHTASLFPGQPSLFVDKQLVTRGTGGPEQITANRMTLTFMAMNKAANIGVLIIGEHKHDITETLSHCVDDQVKYPISGVKPEKGKMTWYIDHTAFLGSPT